MLLAQSEYNRSPKEKESLNLFDPAFQSSIVLPYIQSFNGSSIEMDESNAFGIEYFDNTHGINYWIENIGNNKALALQVFPKDVASMGNCASDKNCPELDTLACCSSRDRCEAKIYPHHTTGKYFYEWKFMIPDDFIIQGIGNNGKKTRHFIAQWHQAYNYESTRRNSELKKTKVKWKHNQIVDCEGRKLNLKGKPPITFNLMHDDNDMDQRLDLVISYGTQYNFHWLENCITDTNSIKGGRQYKIKNIVNAGQWVKILTEINWSSDVSEGYMRIWVNDLPYEITMENDVRILEESNGSSPSKIIGANLYIDKYEYAQPNYLKLGHYRSNMSVAHLIFIDDIKITEAYPVP